MKVWIYNYSVSVKVVLIVINVGFILYMELWEFKEIIL